ncbi:hypothetical protein BJ138DRAFT_1118025 [Hygrophoropsis aurantiaca]|uniref:Uncharacterized protein n=1 Tax=Hygrophoropsis aurantiaca TaxID=72124 RepID=A0ACB7ZYC0_9AGAM|nr:hypothetical protein BJ138DRAFT_1118025 [Hygrophoropsis aurantiaca]
MDGRWLPGAPATPSGLVALLQRCTKLDSLALPVDFSTIDSADFDPSTTHYSKGLGTQLRNLHLGPLNISNPHAVARFLALIMPNCSLSMITWPGGENISRPNWLETETLFHTFRDELAQNKPKLNA